MSKYKHYAPSLLGSVFHEVRLKINEGFAANSQFWNAHCGEI